MSSTQENDPPCLPTKSRFIDRLPDPNPLLPYQFQEFDVKCVYAQKSLPQFNLTQPTRQARHLNFDCCDQEFLYDHRSECRMTLFQHDHYYRAQRVYLKFDLPPNRKHFATSIYPLYIRDTTYFHVPKENVSDGLSFDSCFESGNLFAAYKITERQYNLVLQNDINSKGHTQWFFFKVSKASKGQSVRFNIINLVKDHSLFSKGMRPLVYSVREGAWRPEGENTRYYRNNIVRVLSLSVGQQPQHHYFTLSFTYTFTHGDDEVYFAHSYPYTLGHLSSYIATQLRDPAVSRYMQCRNLCLTLGGNYCPLLTISDSQQQQKKDCVVLMARQHPGETTGSFLMEGCIAFLTDNTYEAQYLRSNFIFKCIPMMNPDGVVYGNYRCDLTGRDINRSWVKPSKQYYPQVHQAKAMVQQQALERNVYMVLDFHSHSKKFNTFFYGNTDKYELEETRVFPQVAAKLSSHIRFQDSRFQVRSSHQATARVSLWKLLNFNPNVFTVETSLFGYEQGGQFHHFTVDHLRNIGRTICQSIFEMHYKRRLEQLRIPCPIESIKTTSANVNTTSANNTTKNVCSEPNLTIADYANQTREKLHENNQSDTSMSESNPSDDNLSDLSLIIKKPNKKRQKLKAYKKQQNQQQQLPPQTRYIRVQENIYDTVRQVAPIQPRSSSNIQPYSNTQPYSNIHLQPQRSSQEQRRRSQLSIETSTTRKLSVNDAKFVQTDPYMGIYYDVPQQNKFKQMASKVKKSMSRRNSFVVQGQKYIDDQPNRNNVTSQTLLTGFDQRRESRVNTPEQTARVRYSNVLCESNKVQVKVFLQNSYKKRDSNHHQQQSTLPVQKVLLNSSANDISMNEASKINFSFNELSQKSRIHYALRRHSLFKLTRRASPK